MSRTPEGTRRALAEARLALARQRPAEAERIIDTVQTRRWPRYELDVALLRAEAGIAIGRSADTVDHEVERALTIADEQLFMRSLLIESEVLGDAPLRALRRAPTGSHRDQLGQRLRTRVPLPKPGDHAGGPHSPSSRELEILRYLATRRSNREIAAELFISLNTMKTHARSLYRRLGVSSRSQAVATGRAHGLV